MTLRAWLVALLVIAVVACARDTPRTSPPAPAPAPPPAANKPDAVRAALLSTHVAALSADDMRGRAPGTDGHRKAEQYVADQLARLGIAPAFPAGYLQEVPLRAARREDAGSALTVGSHTFEHAKEVVIMPTTRAEVIDAEADVTYVGFGLRAAEYGHDDLDGVDTRGRILVVFQGAPARFPPLARAIYGLRKPHRLRDSGAAGLIVVMSPETSSIVRLGQLAESQREATNWYRGDVAGDPEMPTALVTFEAFERILSAAKAGSTARALFDNAVAGARGTRSLNIRAHLRIRTTHRAAPAANVVGVVPGSDPVRKHEMVVVTAHLDHLGVSTPVNGDDIYNGAIDNAFGVALLLELARMTASRPAARTIVFAAVTAEETGMAGSSYLARHPPGRVVANINLDPMGPLESVTGVHAIGADHSSIAQAAAEASMRTGIAVAPPLENALPFMMSDQYNFVRVGVPAVYPIPIHGPRDDDWKAQHWHMPSDQWTKGSSTEPLAQFGAFVHALLRAMGDAAATPAWNADSLFHNHRW